MLTKIHMLTMENVGTYNSIVHSAVGKYGSDQWIWQDCSLSKNLIL